MCIKESLRHSPAVYAIGRELENPIEIDGVMLEPGTQIDLHIYAIHHNPLVWGEDHTVKSYITLITRHRIVLLSLILPSTKFCFFFPGI